MSASQSTLLPLIKAHYGKVLGVAALALVVTYSYTTFYSQPKARLLSQIQDSRAAANSLEDHLRGQFDIADRMKACGATTLGTKLDEVSARFRDGLSHLAEAQGLSAITVDHGEPADIKNPLFAVRGLPTSLRTALKAPADFSILRGTIRGTGTVEAALKTIAAVQTQPWIHRVDSFSIKPVAAKEGEKCELRLEVATIYAPQFTGVTSNTAQLAVTPSAPESQAMWTAIVAKHSLARTLAKPAAVPTIAVAPAANIAAPAPPPQAFAPYEDWKLTGVVSGHAGPEAFFTNLKTSQRLTVPKGGVVLDAVFIDGASETIEIEIAGKRFQVSNGETLAQRRPVAPVSAAK